MCSPPSRCRIDRAALARALDRRCSCLSSNSPGLALRLGPAGGSNLALALADTQIERTLTARRTFVLASQPRIALSLTNDRRDRTTSHPCTGGRPARTSTAPTNKPHE